MKRTVRSFYDLLQFAAYGPKTTPALRDGRHVVMPHRHAGRLYVSAKDRWTEENTDKKGDFKQTGFDFPADFSAAQSWAIDYAARGWDVYWCPNLMAGRRSLKNSTQVWVLSFEVDGPVADKQFLDSLQPVVLDSGTPGHIHVYILLREPMDPVAANDLCLRIAQRVSPDYQDKSQDNAFLRVPRTVNRKAEANGARVTFTSVRARVWSSAALNNHAGHDDPTPGVTSPQRGVQGRLTTDQRAVIAEHMTATKGERSDAIWGVLTTCAEAGLDKNAAVEMVADSSLFDHYTENWNGRADAQLRKEVNKAYRLTSPRAAAAEGPTRITGVSMADVEATQVDWLWHNRLPLGKMVVLEGDPGTTKSLLSLYLAAQVSTGGEWPDGTDVMHPGGVGIMTSEDDFSDTVKPRLEIAGARMDKVYDIGHVTDDEGNSRPVHLGDVEAIRGAIRALGLRLIIVDTLTSFYPPGTKTVDDSSIRQALTPVLEVMQEERCTLLVLRHLRKSSDGPSIYKGAGSIAVTGLARVTLGLRQDTTEGMDPTTDRLLFVVKTNVGSYPPSVKYKSTSVGQFPHTLPAIEWNGMSDLTVHDIDEENKHADAGSGGKRAPKKRELAEAACREVFAESGPRVGAVDLLALVRDKLEGDVSDGTIKNAASAVGAVANKVGKRWEWVRYG